MDTSREDVGISIRSAFLRKGTQQRFSLFALTIISILLIFLETIDAKPLNRIRSFVKDVIYRSAVVATYPTKIFSGSYSLIQDHFGLYRNYKDLKKEIDTALKFKIESVINKFNLVRRDEFEVHKMIVSKMQKEINKIKVKSNYKKLKRRTKKGKRS